RPLVQLGAGPGDAETARRSLRRAGDRGLCDDRDLASSDFQSIATRRAQAGQCGPRNERRNRSHWRGECAAPAGARRRGERGRGGGDAGGNEEGLMDGWFGRGGLGVLDREGYLSVTGRIKELINRGGEKISPVQVDDVLLGHPAVAMAASFGVPDPIYGEEI